MSGTDAEMHLDRADAMELDGSAIDEADGVRASTVERALAEEDLSDEAVEGPPLLCGNWVDAQTRCALPEPCPVHTMPATTSAGDTYDESTGEVLKDAPGWDKTTRSILNRDGLEWAGRHLREVEEALAENHQAAAAELAELEEKLRKAQERHAKSDAPLLKSRDFFDTAIRAYADSHRAELLKGRRGKTARLPCGLVLAWKSGGGEYRWRKDMNSKEREDVLMAWALKEEADSGETLVKAKWSPDLDKIKKHLTALDRESLKETLADKDAPPGLAYVPEHEELSIKVEDDK